MSEALTPDSRKPGQIIPPKYNGGSCSLDPMGPRVKHTSPVRAVVVATRRRGWPCHDRHACAGGDCLRPGIRPTWHNWTLCDHNSTARICRVRSKPYFDFGTRLSACGFDLGCSPAVVGG